MTICRYISIQTVIILRDRVICSSSVYPAAAVDAKGFSSLCRITELLPRTKYGNRGNFYYMNFSVVQSLQLLVLVLVWQRCGSKQQQQQSCCCRLLLYTAVARRSIRSSIRTIALTTAGSSLLYSSRHTATSIQQYQMYGSRARCCCCTRYAIYDTTGAER